MKNRLREEAEFLGGLFSTHDILGEQTAWADFYCLSRRRGVLYNGIIETAKYRYAEMADSQAWDESELILPSPDLFEGSYRDASGNLVIPSRSEPQEAFGGIPRLQWIRRRAAEIADARTLSVCESVEIDPSYGYGIGLHVCLDVPSITIEAVESFVQDFLARGEAPWRGAAPLSWPASEIRFGLNSNALASPSEWAESRKPAQAALSESEALSLSLPAAAPNSPARRGSL